MKSSKNHIKVREYSTYRLIFGLVLKLQKLWCANEAFHIILLQRHQKFRCVIIFLSGMQWKIPTGKHNRYRVGWKWSTRRLVEDGMSTGFTNTHRRLVDSLICITCSFENNAFSVLYYVMVALHYSMLSIRDFFSPWNNRTRLY